MTFSLSNKSHPSISHKSQTLHCQSPSPQIPFLKSSISTALFPNPINLSSTPSAAVILSDSPKSLTATSASQATPVKVSLKFVYLGISTGIVAFFQMSCWGKTSHWRDHWQNVRGYTILIQEAMGEKVGKFIQLLSTFIGGFVIAFIKGWRLTLVLLGCIPLIVTVGGTMAMIVSKMSTKGQKAYVEAGTVVEQTVGAIQTVASFTEEKQAIEKHNKKLKVAYF